MLRKLFGRDRKQPTAEEALPGREHTRRPADDHHVLGRSMTPPFPEGHEVVLLGMGCFWGAERIFWQLPGVHVTAVGYSGGHTANPTYREVCSGRTGHAEVVQVVYDPGALPFEELLRHFWEGHDPTQGMRQGADVGTQYRSAIYTTTEPQRKLAEASRTTYQAELESAGHGTITTEIAPAGPFSYAEPKHQQYLSKNPAGYCGIGGTGVACPTGLSAGATETATS